MDLTVTVWCGYGKLSPRNCILALFHSDLNDLIGTLTFQRMLTNLIGVSPDIS